MKTFVKGLAAAAAGFGYGILAVVFSAVVTGMGYPLDPFDAVAALALAMAVQGKMK